MRISQRFNLGKTQYELDFIDIDPERDTPLFIDPYFLGTRDDPWSVTASRTIRSFFEQFLVLVRSGDHARARQLFEHLKEPNETCLGVSSDHPRGRGIGRENADDIFQSLLRSRAVATGLVEHLEDARIFVRGIDKDKTSDMATNILRAQLLAYTQQQCELWGIPTREDVAAGFAWSPLNRRWEPVRASMPVVSGNPILLVPKAVVSYADRYTSNQYHSQFVLEFLQHEHLRMNSALVQRKTRKDGSEKRWVTKDSLKATEAPLTKEFLADFTARHPEVFRDFRERTRLKLKRLENESLTPERLDAVVDHLVGELRGITPGGEHATRYHRTIVGILELLFYPQLFAPQVEREIHDGRKRIDIVFDNGAETGFFYQLHATHKLPSGYIMVECKNYSRDVANPELDQISGRFSPNRGKVGLIVCRSVDDMETFLNRCADTYRDDRGLVIPLVDVDLIQLLEALKTGARGAEEDLLRERQRRIILT